MGTSSSYRAPERPRWHGFLAALTSDAPIERVRSELFNAGTDWQTEIASPAVATFAEAIARLHAEMPERLAQTGQADVAIGAVIAEARHASMQAGFSAASAIAERAFARLLLTTVQGVADDPGNAGERWRAGRGSAPAELVAKYVGEVLGQYARHVTDREAGRLVGQRLGAEASAQISESLAERAAAIGTAAATDALRAPGDISAGWAQLVNRAFEAGRALPRSDS